MTAMQPVPESQLFRAIFDTAADAMIVVGHNGRILLANPQADTLFGHAPRQLVGRAVETLLPEGLPTSQDAGQNASLHAHRTGAGHEMIGVRGDGETFPVEIALSPIVSYEGTLLAASIRDLSATQRQRQAMARARFDVFVAQAGRLVLESPHYEAAIDDLPSLLSAAMDTESIAIVFIQPRSEELKIRAATGLSPGTRQAINDAFAHDGARHRIVPSDIELLAIGGDTEGEFAHFRETLGQLGFRHAAMVPLLDRVEPMGMVLALAREEESFTHDSLHFLQSVANMLAATIQRTRSEEQLAHAQRLDSLGQLTGGIAHDFNNLLTVISGNLQLLEAGAVDRADAGEVIASATRAVDRCTSLTRKLLGFARRRRLLPTAVQPEHTLAGVADMLRRTLGEGITLTVDCPPGVPAVYADPGELDTALVNLAINARDAMPSGGKLMISVHERTLSAAIEELGLAAGRYVVFEVADTGSGMSREVMSHALEPFFTTKDVGKGSGLGLSMVYGFVRQSGGQLSIDSEPGRGTRVDLMLPVALSPTVRTRQVETAQVTGSESILVVEDEPDVRQVAATFLRSMGYQVYEAADAETAVQMLQTLPQIALLFSDVMLGGGMTGVDLAREAQSQRASLKVLLTSGYERTTLGGTSSVPPSMPLLPKPYRCNELAVAARQVLDGRSAL
ncbi:PAS domain S-box protein [Dyella sp.]|jgi:PAS domain S-box-containing protein|uniref:PAS domain S-box protein n=1 Tax=Dyella sp. TaxID=1869338 RepID=UPI002D76ABF3|nr:PAS domain S-box protein [Dyella sp.]HET6432797.1 PAS domain S-box protein [Dyella sp.]